MAKLVIANIFNTYSQHLIRRSFLISTLVWIVMVFLDFSVTLVLELENINEDMDFYVIFNSVLLEQPHKGMQYLESSMLIGTLIALTIFNQQGNLIFLRSVGFSPIKIVLISGIGPIVFSFFLIIIDEAIFLDLSKKSQALNQSEQSEEVFQWAISKKKLIGLERLNNSDATSIQIVEFNEQQKIISSSIYNEGKLNNGELKLSNSSGQKALHFPVSFLVSDSKLETFSLASLLSLKGSYKSLDDTWRINSLIYKRMLLPLSIIAIIFLAGSLMFENLRSVGVGRQIIIGISLGLIYDLLKDLSVASFMTYQWPVLIAHLLPIIILICIGSCKFKRI